MVASVQDLGDLAARLDLPAREGCSFGPFTVSLRGPRQVPIDLRGTTLRSAIRRRNVDTKILNTFDIEVFDEARGRFRFGLPVNRINYIAGLDRRTEVVRLHYGITVEDTYMMRRLLVYGEIVLMLGVVP